MASVLVTGATGRQGGSVVDALVDAGVDHDVRALVRDPGSDAARALARRGVTVVRGDLSAPHTLREAMADAEYVFLVTSHFDAGRAGEVRQGRNAVLAARDAGVDHLVFSSVWHADRAPALEQFRSKHAIESVLARTGLSYTVVRPTFFAQNVEADRAAIEAGELALPLAPRARLPIVDVADVGRVVARIVESPADFDGETIELAGDAVTLREMAAAFERVLDREVTPVHVRYDDAVDAMGEELADTYRWYNRTEIPATPAAVTRTTGVRPRTFGEYLREHWATADDVGVGTGVEEAAPGGRTA